MRLLLAAAALSLAACQSTNPVSMTYAPSPTVAPLPARTSVIAGGFIDDRREPAKWLGAIRGGYGNPLKVLEVEDSVAAMVRKAFADGLKARGAAAEGASRYELRGSIRKFDCSQYVRREAHAVIEVTLVDTGSGRERFKRSYTSDVVDGSLLNLSTGIFASVDELRQTAEKALREVVDKALDDPGLRDALRS
jgi:ABC-type uncharacterized transport system auxiliary subunit